MEKINFLKKKLKNNKKVLGTWSSMASPNVIDVLSTTGIDFVILDMEHGSMSFETIENMVRAAEAGGISPIVRAFNDHEQTLLRILETGAQSIMVPHVKTAKDAERIANACKYFPIGNRGLSPYTRLHQYTHENLEASLNKANENNFVGILVEGKEGLNNLEEIVCVSNIDLIYLGLFDICQSVGMPGQLNHKIVIDEIQRCQQIIQSKDIATGSMAKDVEYAKILIKMEYNFIAYLNDAAALKKYFIESLKQIQKV